MALGATFASALTAFAAGNTSGLVQINLAGIGIGALALGTCTTPAIPCASGDECACLTGAETVVGQPKGFNKGSLTFELSIDQSSSALPVSIAGDCRPARGFATLKNSEGNVTVAMDVSGFACPTVDGAAEVFNGSYWVIAGSGRDAFTMGTGAINGSLAAAMASPTRTAISGVALDGNLQR